MPTPAARPSTDAINAALGGVNDPEIGRPITELGMVEAVVVADDATVTVRVFP